MGIVGREGAYGRGGWYRLRASQDSRALWFPRHPYCEFLFCLLHSEGLLLGSCDFSGVLGFLGFNLSVFVSFSC